MVGYVAAIMSNSDRLFSRLVIANSFPGWFWFCGMFYCHDVEIICKEFLQFLNFKFFKCLIIQFFLFIQSWLICKIVEWTMRNLFNSKQFLNLHDFFFSRMIFILVYKVYLLPNREQSLLIIRIFETNFWSNFYRNVKEISNIKRFEI